MVFAMCLLTGHIWDTYIYVPYRDLRLKWKYRKQAAEVKRKYTNPTFAPWYKRSKYDE